ncbi:hypothetical protein LXL04_030893 [Taraxacum kok-saghyz]
MGVCFSNLTKDTSPFHSGESSKNGNNDLGTQNSSKVSSLPPAPRTEGEILQASNLKSFTFSDLKTAPETSGRIAEVDYLGQFSHPNHVKLIGYCLEDEQRLLVYEFMPRGSLENHLFKSKRILFSTVVMESSIKAALGAAKGLAFLHNAKTKVIYRDFKTSNVLLDSNYNAKLSDFGLAKDGPIGHKSHVSTRIMGTYGYAAPEYLATGHLTSKSDVYSFGVVFLEMLSGRRAVDKNRPSGEYILVEWAKPYLAHKRKLFRVIDNRLEGQYTLEGAHAVATVALRCLSAEPRLRPNMLEVVKELEQLQDPKGSRPRRHSTHGAQPESRRRIYQLMCSGSWDKYLKIWNTSNLRCVESIKAYDDAINAVNKERSVPVRSVAGGDSGNHRCTNWIWRNGFLSRSPVEIAEIAGGRNRSARSAGNLDAGEMETIEG